MNSRSPRKVRFKPQAVSARMPGSMAKVFQVGRVLVFQGLMQSYQPTDQEKFRQEINLKHQKKIQARLFNKWKGRF
jgi:hypothetical protein